MKMKKNEKKNEKRKWIGQASSPGGRRGLRPPACAREIVSS